MKNCFNLFLLIQKPCLPLRTRKNNWIIHFIPKWPPSGKKWDESRKRGHAKSEIFTVSPKTFRAKVQTSYDKEEKTSQHALYGPHLLIKEDIPGKCSCRKKTVNIEGHRMKVLVTRFGWLVQRTVNQSSARKKLRLIYSPEMFAVWVIQIKVLILLFQGGGIWNKKFGSKYCRSRSRDDLH